MNIKYEVRSFQIWRVGQSVKWDCTTREIAEEIGISASYVATICRKRGWKCNPDQRQPTRHYSTPKPLNGENLANHWEPIYQYSH